jgi:hypothetical protein
MEQTVRRMPKGGEVWKHKTLAHDIQILEGPMLGSIVLGEGLMLKIQGPVPGDVSKMSLTDLWKDYNPPQRSEEELAKIMLFKAFNEIGFNYAKLSDEYKRLISEEEFDRLLPWSMPK